MNDNESNGFYLASSVDRRVGLLRKMGELKAVEDDLDEIAARQREREPNSAAPDLVVTALDQRAVFEAYNKRKATPPAASTNMPTSELAEVDRQLVALTSK